jgi:fucose permease
LGAFVTPLIIGLLLKKLGYKTTGNIIAIIIFIPVFFAILAKGFPEVPAGFPVSEAIGLLTKGIVISAALALFCYIALEASMGGWISTYLNSLGFTERSANLTLSAFWISLMAGRLLAAGFGVKPIVTPELGVLPIVILSVISIITILLMILAKSKSLAGFAVVLTGLAFGPIFPTIIGIMFSKVEPTLRGSAFGISFAIGLIGASTIPAAIGIYSKGKTIQRSLMIAMITAIALFITTIIMGWF